MPPRFYASLFRRFFPRVLFPLLSAVAGLSSPALPAIFTIFSIIADSVSVSLQFLRIEVSLSIFLFIAAGSGSVRLASRFVRRHHARRFFGFTPPVSSPLFAFFHLLFATSRRRRPLLPRLPFFQF